MKKWTDVNRVLTVGKAVMMILVLFGISSTGEAKSGGIPGMIRT